MSAAVPRESRGARFLQAANAVSPFDWTASSSPSSTSSSSPSSDTERKEGDRGGGGGSRRGRGAGAVLPSTESSVPVRRVREVFRPAGTITVVKQSTPPSTPPFTSAASPAPSPASDDQLALSPPALDSTTDRPSSSSSSSPSPPPPPPLFSAADPDEEQQRLLCFVNEWNDSSSSHCQLTLEQMSVLRHGVMRRDESITAILLAHSTTSSSPSSLSSLHSTVTSVVGGVTASEVSCRSLQSAELEVSSRHLRGGAVGGRHPPSLPDCHRPPRLHRL